MLIIPTKEQIVSTCYIQVLLNNVICSKFSIQEAKINKNKFSSTKYQRYLEVWRITSNIVVPLEPLTQMN